MRRPSLNDGSPAEFVTYWCEHGWIEPMSVNEKDTVAVITGIQQDSVIPAKAGIQRLLFNDGFPRLRGDDGSFAEAVAQRRESCGIRHLLV